MRFVVTTEKDPYYFQTFELLLCLDKVGVLCAWQHMGCIRGYFRKVIENNKEYYGPEKMGWDTIWDTHIDMEDVSFKMRNYSDFVPTAIRRCGMRIFVVPSGVRPPSPRNEPAIDALLNDHSGERKWPFGNAEPPDYIRERKILEDGETENIRCLDVASFCNVDDVELYITLDEHAKINAGVSRLKSGKSDVFSVRDEGLEGQPYRRRRLTVIRCEGELPSWAIT